MNLNKIIRSLDLAKSDARDKTIEGIIEYILFCVNENITVDELSEFIQIELSIELSKTELEEGLRKLKDENLIINDSTLGKYSLSTERSLELKKVEIQNSEAETVRFKQFSTSIKKYSNKPLTSPEITLLWTTLTQYIYECYLEHGKIALNVFSPKKDMNDVDVDLSSILNKYANTLKSSQLSKTFKKYVENFPNEISSESINYLVNLANKSEAFFALGLSKEEYDHIYQDIVFDWTIFVDTNFLYSILDLHSHPDSLAAKVLVDMGSELNIKFRYLSITLSELQNKGKDFATYIPQNLKTSQIKALIESEQLDNFTTRYFEKKLIDMNNTPHPIDIVGHAQNTLKSKGIEIFKYPFDTLTAQESYLKDQESKYSNFLRYLDEQRQEMGLRIKGAKDIRQIYHDTFLREVIIYLRDNKKLDTINDVKYFGVTLDKTLIKFDFYETMKKKDGTNIPCFFSPTILLKKLLKYSPVKSVDYKRAFIATLSTPALENNSYTSKIALRSVKYFNNMGITDEKMILNCIKDEMFLNKFKELENNSEQLTEFVESEIQKNYKKLNDELTEKEGMLQQKNLTLTDLHEQFQAIDKENKEVSSENEKLNSQVNELRKSIKVYDNTISKLQKGSKVIDENLYQLTFEDERKNKHIDSISENYEKRIQALNNKIDNLEDYKLYITWRKKSLYNLPIIVIAVFLILMIFLWQKSSWNFMASLFDWYDSVSDSRQEILKGIGGIILTGIAVIPSKIIYQRFFSNKAKKEFFENLKEK